MTDFRSDLMKILSERGHIHQCTDLEGLDRLALKETITGYIGFDATADSLHVGHLAGIMLLRRLQQTGHRPIALMGGGTTKIGDPSDKTGLRQMMSDDAIASNIARIEEIFKSYLDFKREKNAAVLVNNAEWLDRLEYIPFLREIGRHFTINRMISFDFVKRRLEQEIPLTFLEFNYMIMQGYDFLELFKRYGCRLQMGGADQWGNIVNGVELGRRIKETELYGLTTPLLLTSSGVKMGKTVSGAVWLRADRLSPYDFWQFWRNTEDGDVIRFLKLFTDLPLSEIARLEHLKDAEINEAKKILAHEATALVHGDVAARKAAETAQETFAGSGKGENLPVFTFARTERPNLIDAVLALNLVASKSEAKRLIEQGGIKLNDQPVTSLTQQIEGSHLDTEGCARVSVGKKKHAILKAI